jgi:ligand-binding sensor domain-containing protein
MDVISLCEDHSDNLWVGTYAHGLLRFNRHTGQFKTFRHDPLDPHSLADDFVRRLLVDHNGTLWAGTEGGLSRFNAVAQQFTTYKFGPSDKKPYYLEIVEDRTGALWLGTELSGLQRFDPATGKLRTFEHDIDRPRL